MTVYQHRWIFLLGKPGSNALALHNAFALY